MPRYARGRWRRAWDRAGVPAPSRSLPAPALHEIERRLEELQVLRVLRRVGAIDLDPLLRGRHAGGLEGAHVLARELQLARGRHGQANADAVAVDAREHPVVHEIS